MAAKNSGKKKEEKQEQAPADAKTNQRDIMSDPSFSALPKDAQEKLKKIKSKLETFQKKIVEKFDKYIIGVALLPPPQPGQQGQQQGQPDALQPAQQPKKKEDPSAIRVLVLVDDSDSKKMSKQELKTKLSAIIESMAKEIDKNLSPETVILSELWTNCYDGKYDMLRTIALAAPVYDTGMLAAIKIAEVHKTMVLKKFEKYIVSYVLSGSLIRGQATPTSDIDVFVVIDDTDVKKMTRAELKDKLRAIIIGMGVEAGELTGIKNKINIQVYILTDFWDSLREANPIIFTLLRDGVPFYDRGIFMPWKQLLLMGKIKPSAEAIDMFMHSGEQMLQRVHYKLREIGMEDTYYAILTPSQAALMLFGVTPPTPKETAQLMREIFVKKEKLLEEKFVDILEHNIKIRKDLEHGTKSNLSGKEVDELVTNAEKYLKRIKRLFSQIEKIKEEEGVLNAYDTTVTVVRDILKMEGVESVPADRLEELFKAELVEKGVATEKHLRLLSKVLKAKKDFEEKKLTKVEIENVKKESRELVKFLVEHMQRKRSRELDRVKVRVKYGDKFGELIILGKVAFIRKDIEAEKKEYLKAKLGNDGSLSDVKEVTQEEYEEELGKVELPEKAFIKERIFSHLKDVFGSEVEILVNY